MNNENNNLLKIVMYYNLFDGNINIKTSTVYVESIIGNLIKLKNGGLFNKDMIHKTFYGDAASDCLLTYIYIFEKDDAEFYKNKCKKRFLEIINKKIKRINEQKRLLVNRKNKIIKEINHGDLSEMQK